MTHRVFVTSIRFFLQKKKKNSSILKTKRARALTLLQTFINVPTSAAEIAEHSSVATTVFTCTATDDDSASQPSGQLRFQITGHTLSVVLYYSYICLVAVILLKLLDLFFPSVIHTNTFLW